MAASSRGARNAGKGTKSAFETQEQDQKDGCSWLDPSVISVVPYASAGLQGLYTQVTRQEPVLDNDTNEFTGENGIFCPKDKMPLLARRYEYLEVIGRGGSSITVRARDTFRPDNYQVAIKILNVNYYRLGYQESSSIRSLNKADPNGFSGTLRLLNMFSFSGHFCMVFELLHPKPLHHYFKEMNSNQERLRWIRRVAIRLLQVLGFLQQENVIHADLKPENVLFESDDLSSGVKVIDFGNAIHCVYDELSLYYDDFELQTLLYRAPEVLFGLPFGPEIDMWSLGCILAELYMGKPLFFALSKDKLLQRMVSVLGPMPASILQRGKFFQDYSAFTGKPQTSLATWAKLHTEMLGVQDPHFISFIAAMLQYNPSDRISVWDAFQHPFLAPEIATRYLLPPSQSGDKKTYPKISISPKTYNLTPEVPLQASKDSISSIDLLRQRTKSSSTDTRMGYQGGLKPSGSRVIAQVTPFVNESQQTYRTHVPAFPLQQDRSEDRPRRPAFQVPPVVNEVMSSNGSQQVGSRRRFGSDVRQPIPVPGKFANSLIPNKEFEENLSDRVSDLYANYQKSNQIHRSGTSISADTQHKEHPHIHNYPSTSSSHQDSQLRTNEKRKLFLSDEVDPVQAASKIILPNVIRVARVSVDNGSELIGEQFLHGHREMKIGKDTDKTASNIRSEGKISVQKGEIFLTKVNESNRTPEKEVRIQSEQIASPARATSSTRESISPMRRWKNLEKTRTEAVNNNKKCFSWGDKYIQEREEMEAKEAKYLASTHFVKRRTLPAKSEASYSHDTFSKQKSVSIEAKRQRTMVAATKSSCEFQSPSHDVKPPCLPSTPSNLATSINKLKASTPTKSETTTKIKASTLTTPKETARAKTTKHRTPGKAKLRASTPTTPGDRVLLMSEYPTPDNAVTSPSTSSDQSPPSEGSHEVCASTEAELSSQERRLADVDSLNSNESSKDAWEAESPKSVEAKSNLHLSPDDSEKTSTNLSSSVKAMQLLTKQVHQKTLTQHHTGDKDVKSVIGTLDVVGRSSCSSSTQRQESQNGSAKKRVYKRKAKVAGENQNMIKQKRTRIAQSEPKSADKVPQIVSTQSRGKQQKTSDSSSKEAKQSMHQNGNKLKSKKDSTPLAKKTQGKRKSPGSSVEKKLSKKNWVFTEKKSPDSYVKRGWPIKKNTAKKNSKSPNPSMQPRKVAEKKKNSPKSRTGPKSQHSEPQKLLKECKQLRKVPARKQSKEKPVHEQGTMKRTSPDQRNKRKLVETEIKDPYEYKETPKKAIPKRQAKRKAADKIHGICQLEDRVPVDGRTLQYDSQPPDSLEEKDEMDIAMIESRRSSSDGSGPVEDDALLALDDGDADPPYEVETEEVMSTEEPEYDDSGNENHEGHLLDDEVLLL